MKIVYCIPSLHNSGGMERVLTQKANYLADKAGYEVYIITSSQKNRKPFFSLSKKIKLIDLGIDYESMLQYAIHKRMMRRIKAKKLHKKFLSKILMNIKPDITISMFTHEMTFLPNIKDGSKKILELHFSKNFRKLDAVSNGRPWLIRMINNILDVIDRKAIKNYDKFVVLSKRDAEDWGKKYKNLEVVHNPCAVLLPPNKHIKNIENKKILAVGRLCRQKGFDLIIDIWKIMPKDIIDTWKLDIVGNGPDLDFLKRRIKEVGLENSISIKPHTDNISHEYQNHDIFCFTSRYEGFGLSLAEAMSFSVPAISFDCPCGPSEIINDSENGFLIEAGNINEFSNKLILLIRNKELRWEMGNNAYLQINDNFSENIIMPKWQSLFDSLCIN